jgi:phosphohistidine phosphatase
MGARFLARGKLVDCIISSPAVRAKATATLFAEAIGFPVADLTSNPELYFAGAPMFLKASSLLDEDFDSAILVGHNPAITEFANNMSGANIENIPTCGLVELTLPIDNWSDVVLASATLVNFDYPKNLVDT